MNHIMLNVFSPLLKTVSLATLTVLEVKAKTHGNTV